MGWDADEIENEYIDYVAEHESGFLSDCPPRLIGFDKALRRIVDDAYGEEGDNDGRETE